MKVHRIYVFVAEFGPPQYENGPMSVGMRPVNGPMGPGGGRGGWGGRGPGGAMRQGPMGMNRGNGGRQNGPPGKMQIPVGTVMANGKKQLMADIIITLDASKNTGPLGFNQSREFIREMLMYYAIGDNSLRMMIIYAEAPAAVFTFEIKKEDMAQNEIMQIGTLMYTGASLV